MSEYHISKFPPTDVFPLGGWSVYRISGDQIAQRIIFENGKVVRRDSWSGFLGCYSSLEKLVETINEFEREEGLKS